MSNDVTTPELVSRDYHRRRQDPIGNAKDILAIWMIRDPNTHPAEPLRIVLDRSAIRRMGWRSGDAITLVPLGPDDGDHRGKLVIRRARPGESAHLLHNVEPKMQPFLADWVDSDIAGPRLAWNFPARWIEVFFPGEYDEDWGDLDSRTERHRMLRDILDQSHQIELRLGPERLFLHLRRSAPSPTTMDVHLIPGLLRLMGWSEKTGLILESATDFDPFTTEDTLTIRECCLGEEPNLSQAAGGLSVEVHPLWLNRFFPDVYEPLEADGSGHSGDHLGFDSDDYSPLECRDTLVVGYPEMFSRVHTLSFEITAPRLR